jgi:hypothetical protein
VTRLAGALRLLPVALAALVLLPGCGGFGSGGGGAAAASASSTAPDAASLVPADALAYVTLDTDLSSKQLENAQAVLGKFPVEAKVLAEIRAEAAKEGVDVDALVAAAGASVDVAVLRVGGKPAVVGFAQPADEQRFEAELAKGGSPTMHRRIDGWTVFADSAGPLDAVAARTASLADDPTYQNALQTIPSSDALARVYVAPAVFRQQAAELSELKSLAPVGRAEWMTAALTSQDGTFRLEAHVKQAKAETVPTSSPLTELVPSDALVAASVNGGGRPLVTDASLRRLSQLLGADLVTLAGALRGPFVAYVRTGNPLPELTLIAQPSDPEAVDKALGPLLARLLRNQAPPDTVVVDGVVLDRLDAGLLSLYWGTYDGKVVVTDSTAAVSTLKGGSSPLVHSAAFKTAAGRAGMPGDSEGFLFLNLHDALPMIEGLAQFGGSSVPADVEQNLEPLDSVLVYGTQDGDLQSVVVSLATS